MRTVVGWVVIAAAVMLIIGLIGWARGPAHHRGDEVGSLAQLPGVSRHA